MFARASVAVAACADFVVEGAVDFVLLRTEDGGEIVGHIDERRPVYGRVCEIGR